MILRTLGGLELEGGIAYRRRKALLLLAYLALEGPTARRVLAELFWPEAKNPRDSLSAALRHAARTLPGRTVDGDAEQAWTTLPCDAALLLLQLEAAPPRRVPVEYPGAFLAGLDLSLGEELEDWVFTTREIIAGRVRSALLDLGEQAAAEGLVDAAARHAEQACELPGARPLEPEDLARVVPLLRAGRSPRLGEVRSRAREAGLWPPEAPATTSRATGESPKRGRLVVPASTRSFLGREAERRDLIKMLETPALRLVTLHGPGGIGKSSLALHVARAPSVRQGFSDGVAFVELGSLASATQVPSQIAKALGLDLQGQSDPDARIATSIGVGRVLLLLDNFESVIEAAELLSDLLEACANLKILVTSRERLKLRAESVLPLEGLPVPPEGAVLERARESPALQLFEDRALRARRDFALGEANLPGALRICRLVGGAPLAIELAAAWTRALSTREIADEIERDLAFLASSARDAQPRHRSVQAALEHSWRRLPEPERDALGKLAVFRGGFRKEAAAPVADAPLPVLMSLGDRSLLQTRERGRFDLHPLVRAFAAERLTDDDRRNAEERHARHYLRLARTWQEKYGTSQHGEMLRVFEAEADNIRAAWSRAVEVGWHQAVSDAACAVSDVFDNRSLDGVRLFAASAERLATEAPGAEARIALGAVQIERSWHLQRLTRYDVAKRWGEEGLEQLGERRTNVTESVLRALVALGELEGRVGDYRRAEALWTEGLDLARQAGTARYQAMFLTGLAYIEMRIPTRPHRDAVEHFRIVAEELRELGYLDFLSNHLCGFGWYLQNHLEPSEARALFEESLALVDRLGSFWITPYSLCGLGAVAFDLGEHDAALAHLDAALLEGEERSEIFVQSQTLAVRARVRVARGELGEARRCVERALELAREVGSAPRALFALVARAEHYARLGDHSEAVQLLEALLEHPSFEERCIAEDLQTRLAAASHVPNRENEADAAAALDLDDLLARFPAPPG